MVKCKYCGNEYRKPVAQCPTCGGRKFDDSLMTIEHGAIGYGMMMSQPFVVQVSNAEYLYQENLYDLKSRYAEQAR